jgi:hypothetical protein
MTNFYQDHLPSDSSFEKLLNVYRELFRVVGKGFRYVDKNTLIDTAQTLNTIPYFKMR